MCSACPKCNRAYKFRTELEPNRSVQLTPVPRGIASEQCKGMGLGLDKKSLFSFALGDDLKRKKGRLCQKKKKTGGRNCPGNSLLAYAIVCVN